MSRHTTTVPVSVQVGTAKTVLTATVFFNYDANGVSQIEVLNAKNTDGSNWLRSEAFAVWIEAHINRDDLRAAVDPEFAAARKAALDAYHAEG